MHLFLCFASHMSYFSFIKFSETWGLDQPPIGNLGTYVFHSEKVQQSLMTTHQPLTEKSRHICENCMYKARIQRNLGGSTMPIESSPKKPRLIHVALHASYTACMFDAHTI